MCSSLPAVDFIIGIHGPAYSGKDSTANLIAAELMGHGYAAFIYSFAAAVKEEVAELLDVPLSAVYSDDYDTKEHFRPIIRAVAEHRKLPEYGGYPTYWIEKATRQITYDVNKSQVPIGVIFSDLRFDVEADWILSHPNSTTIRIVVSNPIKTCNDSSHVSEKPLPESKLRLSIANDQSKGFTNYSDIVSRFVKEKIVPICKPH